MQMREGEIRMKRSANALGFAVLAFLAFTGWAVGRTVQVAQEFKDNDALTSSAPQQTVAALWAIKEAAIQTMLFSGIAVALLVVAIIYLALIASRENSPKEAPPNSPPSR
jgi:hypothetical protein